jgi:HicB-like protein involved in pilus formation
MDLARHVTAVQSDLASAAALGGDDVAEAGRRLAEAAAPALQLRLLDLLSEAALGLNAQLPEGHVELRLAGRDPDLVYVTQATPDATGAAEAATSDYDARITLRLPDALKVAAETAADKEGISTNAWIVRALKRELDARPSGRVRSGNRLQGFAQS